MRSITALSPHMYSQGNRSPLETVRISSELIAFYPQPLRHAQPYVILVDAASGILRRLDLQTAKQKLRP